MPSNCRIPVTRGSPSTCRSRAFSFYFFPSLRHQIPELEHCMFMVATSCWMSSTKPAQSNFDITYIDPLTCKGSFQVEVTSTPSGFNPSPWKRTLHHTSYLVGRPWCCISRGASKIVPGRNLLWFNPAPIDRAEKHSSNSKIIPAVNSSYIRRSKGRNGNISDAIPPNDMTVPLACDVC